MNMKELSRKWSKRQYSKMDHSLAMHDRSSIPVAFASLVCEIENEREK